MTDLIPISTFNSCRMNGTITPVQKQKKKKGINNLFAFLIAKLKNPLYGLKNSPDKKQYNGMRKVLPTIVLNSYPM